MAIVASTGTSDISRQFALRFVVMLGLVSLFSDVTYEGARAVTGPYLNLLGASAAVVGAVAGAGELLGYGLRILTGYIADRTGRYWTLTIVGYAVNLGAVPLLALTGHWQIAAALVLLERVGKSIRTPARDAMLSHAASGSGVGWTFALHEALDQIGALTGPLIVAFVLAGGERYHVAFAVLAIPAAAALLTLLVAQRQYPNPEHLEVRKLDLESSGFPARYWWYLAAAGLMAIGFVDFPLMAYHLKRTALTTDRWIPILYAAAMGIDAIAALAFGRLFDRFGVPVLAVAAVIGAAAPPLVFLYGFHAAVAGILLWGVGMGAIESILRAAIGTMVAANRRGSAYGVFNTGYGIFWFVGSAICGRLYEHHIGAMAVFAAAAQLSSIPFFLHARRHSPAGSLE